MLQSTAPTPFGIHVDDAVLSHLHDRLRRTRFASRTGREWEAGTDPAYLRELVDYWLTQYDWRARERAMNRFPQFTTLVDGNRLHFVHLRSGQSRAVPLLLTHGWPSAFLEFLDLSESLETLAGHFGISFDLVIPSLPGFFHSDLPRHGPATSDVTARLWKTLMTEVLGYQRFGAYGGDIGSHVTNFLGAMYAPHLLGIYTHHPELHPVIDPDVPLTRAERAYLDERAAHATDGSGYSAIQSTRPDTLAAALLDSPAGLASWIIEKLRAWSDCGGNLETRFGKDSILDLVMLYWATGSIGTSFRPYYDDSKTAALSRIEVPAGITLTPEDHHYPIEFARRTYADIRAWHGATTGGHFLAFEEPALLARHLCSFFAPLVADQDIVLSR